MEYDDDEPQLREVRRVFHDGDTRQDDMRVLQAGDAEGTQGVDAL